MNFRELSVLGITHKLGHTKTLAVKMCYWPYMDEYIPGGQDRERKSTFNWLNAVYVGTRRVHRGSLCQSENMKCFKCFLCLCSYLDYIRECIIGKDIKDNYRGRRSWTKSNITCQAWANNDINEHMWVLPFLNQDSQQKVTFYGY